MAQAILLADVEGLGENGTAVEVSAGYLRNYLQPRGLAQPATPGALEAAIQRKAAAEKAEREAAERASEVASLLSKTVLTIHHRAGEDGKLYGSVTNKEIADAIRDASGDVIIGGVMEHVEEAGVHSGDSACVLPPMSIGEAMLDEIAEATSLIAADLGVVGLINIQYAISDGRLFVIEANPRASRTVPFVSKATGVPLAKLATRLMLGDSVDQLELPEPGGDHVSVKEAVLPFSRFSGADSLLGPEMKSTGEVIGIGPDFPTAFGKAQRAAGAGLPSEGTVFISVTDTDKPAATQLAARFHDLGFAVVATEGTARAISGMGIPVETICKLGEGSPSVVDLIEEERCDLVINTPTGSGARTDGYEIRSASIRRGIPCITTMTGASAAVRAITAEREGPGDVWSLQELHAT